MDSDVRDIHNLEAPQLKKRLEVLHSIIRTNIIRMKKFQTKLKERSSVEMILRRIIFKKKNRFLISLFCFVLTVNVEERQWVKMRGAAEAVGGGTTCIALIFFLDYLGCVCWLVRALAGGRRRGEE